MRVAVVAAGAVVVLGALGAAAVAGIGGDGGSGDLGRAASTCPDLGGPSSPGTSAAVLPATDGPDPAAYTLEVVARTPHDESAFTQGLVHAGGLMYEGTGEYGRSRIRLVEPASGDVVAERALPASMFGEGVAGHDGRLYQLTWRDERVLVRDRCSLDEVGRMAYDGEGWGLTGDGEVLWRSDGTSTLFAHDPEGFAVTRTVEVRDRGRPVERLNELELVDGQILANVWKTPWIARIDPASGGITGWIDASALVTEIGASDPDEVLNGIAVDAASGRLWLTGKRWPTVFEVRVVPGTRLP